MEPGRPRFLACPTQSTGHVAVDRRGGPASKGGPLGRRCRADVGVAGRPWALKPSERGAHTVPMSRVTSARLARAVTVARLTPCPRHTRGYCRAGEARRESA